MFYFVSETTDYYGYPINSNPYPPQSQPYQPSFCPTANVSAMPCVEFGKSNSSAFMPVKEDPAYMTTTNKGYENSCFRSQIADGFTDSQQTQNESEDLVNELLTIMEPSGSQSNMVNGPPPIYNTAHSDRARSMSVSSRSYATKSSHMASGLLAYNE